MVSKNITQGGNKMQKTINGITYKATRRSSMGNHNGYTVVISKDGMTRKLKCMKLKAEDAIEYGRQWAIKNGYDR
jgi:hypothetical protein